jgi:hypothetical protein
MRFGEGSKELEKNPRGRWLKSNPHSTSGQPGNGLNRELVKRQPMAPGNQQSVGYKRHQPRVEKGSFWGRPKAGKLPEGRKFFKGY